MLPSHGMTPHQIDCIALAACSAASIYDQPGEQEEARMAENLSAVGWMLHDESGLWEHGWIGAGNKNVACNLLTAVRFQKWVDAGRPTL